MRSELESAPKGSIDAMTFSGTGEPTLNSQLGEMIDYAGHFGIRVVVLTDSSLLSDAGICRDLGRADIVAAKPDAQMRGFLEKSTTLLKDSIFRLLWMASRPSVRDSGESLRSR